MKKLKFGHYKVEKLSFTQEEDFYDEESINVSMGSRVEMINSDSAVVSIICNLETEDEKFNLFIHVSGEFLVEEDGSAENITGITNEMLLSRNSISILFPYVRAAVSQVTSIGYNNPIVLPPINVLDFIQKSKEEEPEK
ncbi:protein-export chaperone SecB [Exiguobacterium sp. s151]|uniref:protein-export chaperone SecB n=1 Tax=Exiguobacterium sp. s151 TaxID=2751229 RepID=UPI001BE7E88F|nr:protein-export chaperone SecB [Exiguobacterium sp. s151]